MLESDMKFRPQRLQFHSRFQTVRRFRAAADETVNFFLDVDERWLHGAVSLIVCIPQSKLTAVKMWQMDVAVEVTRLKLSQRLLTSSATQ